MARVLNKDLQAPHRIQNLLSIVKRSSDPLQSEGQLNPKVSHVICGQPNLSKVEAQITAKFRQDQDLQPRATSPRSQEVIANQSSEEVEEWECTPALLYLKIKI